MGGTPLVEQAECLGVAGMLNEIPVTRGGVSSTEMIGSVTFPTLLSLSLDAGVVTLPIGVTGSIDSTFIWLKESEECE